MAAALPGNREGVRSRATFQIGLGLFAIASGTSILVGWIEPDDRGWTGVVPDSWHPAIAALLVVVGIGFLVPGLIWVCSGSKRPVVRFDVDHLEIIGSLVPKTFTVDRDSVESVHLYSFSRFIPPSFGMSPMVVLRTKDGHGRGIQYLYDGDAQALLEDVARWASAPIGTPRSGVFHIEESRPSS